MISAKAFTARVRPAAEAKGDTLPPNYLCRHCSRHSPPRYFAASYKPASAGARDERLGAVGPCAASITVGGVKVDDQLREGAVPATVEHVTAAIHAYTAYMRLGSPLRHANAEAGGALPSTIERPNRRA